MEFLMKIGDAFYLEKEGYIIIGTDPSWTVSDVGKLKLKRENVIIKTSKGDYSFDVVNINTTTSFHDKLTIGMTLKESNNFKNISKGDMVFRNISLS